MLGFVAVVLTASCPCASGRGWAPPYSSILDQRSSDPDGDPELWAALIYQHRPSPGPDDMTETANPNVNPGFIRNQSWFWFWFWWDSEIHLSNQTSDALFNPSKFPFILILSVKVDIYFEIPRSCCHFLFVNYIHIHKQRQL